MSELKSIFFLQSMQDVGQRSTAWLWYFIVEYKVRIRHFWRVCTRSYCKVSKKSILKTWNNLWLLAKVFKKVFGPILKILKQWLILENFSIEAMFDRRQNFCSIWEIFEIFPVSTKFGSNLKLKLTSFLRHKICIFCRIRLDLKIFWWYWQT